MSDLLFEILSEEIPARMQAKAAEDLARLTGDALAKNGLQPKSLETHATPRRLVLAVSGLPLAQPDVTEERRGPRVGAPPAALDGFLKGAGVTLEQCEQRDTGKGIFYFANLTKQGRATALVLKEILEAVMAEFPWPKSMRWGAHAVRWVRPIQSILCLFDGKIVPVAFGPAVAGKITRGHRFLAPGEIEIADYAQYKSALAAAFVILDRAERKRLVLERAKALAEAEGLTLKADEGLAEEVAGLVEWPVPMLGRIDDKFMDVPPEVLTTAMRAHQKYFSLLTKEGKLASRFVLVTNKEGKGGNRAIVAGNERVLRARLSDAKFFWEQDKKQPLDHYAPKLVERVYHAKLGTMADKVERMRKLAVEVAKFVPGADPARVDRAILLAKADLSTGMVGEFPELQGIMGRYYALAHGENPEVAEAVREHYSPLGPADSCPKAPVSVVVALAEKIDSLNGFWSIDEKPTGSKDPFALRRAALGVIRIILENELRVGLSKIFAAPDLLDFFADRLKVHLKEKGVRHDLIAAVFALGGEDDLVRLLARVKALQDFLASEDGANLLVAYRRAANILKIEEKKDGISYGGAPDAAQWVADEEKALSRLLDGQAPKVDAALKAENFVAAMAELAALRSPVDKFFDKVTVNAEDKNLRANRLKLLSRIRGAMDRIADFSKIEG